MLLDLLNCTEYRNAATVKHQDETAEGIKYCPCYIDQMVKFSSINQFVIRYFLIACLLSSIIKHKYLRDPVDLRIVPWLTVLIQQLSLFF